MEKTEIGKLFEFSLKVLEKARVPLYSGKFSKRTYTQRQHLALLVLKTFLKADYRKVCQIAEDLWASFAVLDLPRIPHFTTLQKFFCRVRNQWLEVLINQVLHHYTSVKYLAIDATGINLYRASRYYSDRIGRGVWWAPYLMMTVLLDVKRRLPLAVRCHSPRKFEGHDLAPLMRKVKFYPQCFLADKGYDSDATLQLLKDRGIRPVIPLRMCPGKIHSRLRRQMLRRWTSEPRIERQYHQRSLIESFFSALKSRLGESVSSRRWWLRRREAMLKVAVYSILRQGRSCLIDEDFYSAGRGVGRIRKMRGEGESGGTGRGGPTHCGTSSIR